MKESNKNRKKPPLIEKKITKSDDIVTVYHWNRITLFATGIAIFLILLIAV